MTESQTIVEKFRRIAPDRRRRKSGQKSLRARMFTVRFNLDRKNPYNVSYLLSFENELLSRYGVKVDLTEIRGGSIEVDYVIEQGKYARQFFDLIREGVVDDLVDRYQIIFLEFQHGHPPKHQRFKFRGRRSRRAP